MSLFYFFEWARVGIEDDESEVYWVITTRFLRYAETHPP